MVLSVGTRRSFTSGQRGVLGRAAAGLLGISTELTHTPAPLGACDPELTRGRSRGSTPSPRQSRRARWASSPSSSWPTKDAARRIGAAINRAGQRDSEQTTRTRAGAEKTRAKTAHNYARAGSSGLARASTFSGPRPHFAVLQVPRLPQGRARSAARQRAEPSRSAAARCDGEQQPADCHPGGTSHRGARWAPYSTGELPLRAEHRRALRRLRLAGPNLSDGDEGAKTRSEPGSDLFGRSV